MPPCRLNATFHSPWRQIHCESNKCSIYDSLIPGNHIYGKCSSLSHLDATTTFELLFKSAELSTFTPEEKQEYQRNMTSELDIKNQIAYAHITGKAEGLAEGEAKGKAEGKAEVARKMLERGIERETISELTGLSPEEVAAL